MVLLVIDALVAFAIYFKCDLIIAKEITQNDQVFIYLIFAFYSTDVIVIQSYQLPKVNYKTPLMV